MAIVFPYIQPETDTSNKAMILEKLKILYGDWLKSASITIVLEDESETTLVNFFYPEIK
jgi:hypothetical protein